MTDAQVLQLLAAIGLSLVGIAIARFMLTGH